MAFDDILTAIIAQTDEYIAQEKQAHQQQLTVLKTDSETQLQALEADITTQKEAKKASMLQKATNHSESIVKNAELQIKQDLLNALFEQVLTRLTQISKEDTTKLLSSYLASLPKEGVIRPSKNHLALITELAKGHTIGEPLNAAGGFLFESAKIEKNCTYEHIVAEEIRLHSELDAASQLFA